MAETTNRILLCQVENIGSVAEVKLVTFMAGGTPEIGIIDENVILPLKRALPGLSRDMIMLIAAWSASVGAICQIITSHKERLRPEGCGYWRLFHVRERFWRLVSIMAIMLRK